MLGDTIGGCWPRRYGSDGSLVGVTIVNARRLLEHEGEIALTLPAQKVRAPDLARVLV